MKVIQAEDCSWLLCATADKHPPDIPNGVRVDLV